MHNDSPLVTDLYQLTMVQSYLDHGMTAPAVFEWFVRRLPADRAFLVFAGLQSVLDFLEHLHFSDEELAWLAGTGRFSSRLLDFLRCLRFQGDVHAMPEGSPLFPDEPALRITAPLPVAQLVETRVINLLHIQTLIASKAARLRIAAGSRLLVDFGLRRSHGAEAGLLAARASFIAGFDGTSNVQAGMAFGIPIMGTMAHSYILAHDDEVLAFEHYAHSHPQQVVLLLDTYDTEEAARKVVALAPRLARAGIKVHGVRLDSGDLARHAVRVRKILDAAGLREARIMVSGNLDEYDVARLVARGAPIDGFGVGTRMSTSSDAPYLDCAYKLQSYAGVPRRKRSEGKATWPGSKQVYRFFRDGCIAYDLVTCADDREQEGLPLLRLVMRNGRRVADAPSMEALRETARVGLRSLPQATLRLHHGQPVPVRIAPRLQALARTVDARQATMGS
ncbi:MAG: nicotinate phosphoribosyltransferase [Zetaproteobacteria bacterium]|nr:MAG: nicotinate phosphoribosyltransferase [Zetaproteobacteria bacterium]